MTTIGIASYLKILDLNLDKIILYIINRNLIILILLINGNILINISCDIQEIKDLIFPKIIN